MTTATLRLLCVCHAGRGRCLEYAEFAGPTAEDAHAAAERAGWGVSAWETRARCPSCTTAGRPFGPLDMDPIHTQEMGR